MPIEQRENEKVVVCLNRTLDDHTLKPDQKSTMMVAAGWHALTGARPADLVDPHIRFNPGVGTPVRICVCQVCGYVELYAGPVQAPEIWPPQK